jgi:flagellar hook-length control protein FliK
MKTTLDAARGPSAALETLRRQRREERETPDELWALALTNTLVAELPKLTQPPPEADASLAAHAVGDSHPPAEHAPELDESRDAAGSGSGAAAGGSRASPELPSRLSAEVSDERLGRLQLHVERVEGGLDIVINVADARVKALIEAEQPQLMKTLKDAGLHVASVQIGGPSRAGTALAQERGGAEKARTSASFRQPAARWRTYTGSPAEEEDADGEGVDLTA